MRFGVCAPVSRAAGLARMGYDYIELSASGDLRGLESDSAHLAEYEDALQASGIAAEAFNGLVPGSLRITGERRDPAGLRAYMRRTCERASRLGGKVLVFGSSGARSVEDGYPYDLAWSEIVEFLKVSADFVVANGLILAIEPLSAQECNIITSVGEGLRLADDVGRPDAVTVLSDMYHVDSDGQSYDETAMAGSRLRHVHVACGADRHAPRDSDTNELSAFFVALKAAGYDDRVSIEAHFGDFEAEVESGLAAMRAHVPASSLSPETGGPRTD